jgi:hypothetical protein
LPFADAETSLFTFPNVFMPINVGITGVKYYGKKGLLAYLIDMQLPVQFLVSLQPKAVCVYVFFNVPVCNTNSSRNKVIISPGYGLKYK